MIGQKTWLDENMVECLSTDIICYEKRTAFREPSWKKAVSFEKQMMSKDRYMSIFSKSHGGFCVYYHWNIFSVLKVGEYLTTLQ